MDNKATYFEVPGKPQGKARARTFYNPKLGHMSSVTPEKTVLYENLIKQCYMACKTRLNWFNKEPLAIEITAVFDVPKSTTKKDTRLMLEDVLHPTKKPDADNIAKVICDALNGVAYTDDTQIIDLMLYKKYGPEPKVIVKISEIRSDFDG